MNTFRFRVYYEKAGQRPCTLKKSPKQILEALHRVPIELRPRLHDLKSQVESSRPREGSNEVYLSICTTDPLESVERALLATLKDWCLYSERLEAGEKDLV